MGVNVSWAPQRASGSQIIKIDTHLPNDYSSPLTINLLSPTLTILRRFNDFTDSRADYELSGDMPTIWRPLFCFLYRFPADGVSVGFGTIDSLFSRSPFYRVLSAWEVYVTRVSFVIAIVTPILSITID